MASRRAFLPALGKRERYTIKGCGPAKTPVGSHRGEPRQPVMSCPRRPTARLRINPISRYHGWQGLDLSSLAAAHPRVPLGLRKHMTRPGFDAEFDVVVVGAGSAGCVLSARLTENPAITL